LGVRDKSERPAAGTPTISSDGLTYTFKLRSNVRFGPPLTRAITSKDVEYAFERINTAPLVAQYGSYYCGVIKGMDCQAKSPAPVSGIETPDDATIVFHLEQPTGTSCTGWPCRRPLPSPGRLIMVRNPNYDQSSDDLRSNCVDGVQISVDTNINDIFNRVESGTLDASYVNQPRRSWRAT